jgi:hypothetical protein
MNNFKEMSLVNRAFLFSMMLLSGTVVCAQDATLAGPTGCGIQSVEKSSTIIGTSR